MNNKKLYASLLMLAVVFTALPAAAGATNISDKISVRIDVSSKTRVDAQIDARVKALTALKARIAQMEKVSVTQKASLTATIDAAVAEMTSLKAKIDADTDSVVLKTDIESLTKSYRIYVLVLPQARIIASADRVMFITGLMTDLSAKLQVRITAAQAAGQDVTALQASLSDMNVKIADANVQAQAALSLVVNLKPDNGDKAMFDSNQAALKDARSKIRIAMTDLKTARKDSGSIIKVVLGAKLDAKLKTSTH